MKNNRLSLAIMAIAIAAIVSAAVVSCKKESQDEKLIHQSASAKKFDINKIKNIDEYLIDFKGKMQSTTKGDDEFLDCEVAAWHIASLANKDFGNANVKYNDLRFDTITTTIPVNEGMVSLADINESYPGICEDIERFQRNLGLNNQHLRFINASVGLDGQTQISMITTFNSPARDLYDHLWYFPETFGYMDSICDYYFDEFTYYPWNGSGQTLLQWAINMHEGVSNLYPPIYYVPSRYHAFQYPNWTDSYGSPFMDNTRVFAIDDNNHYNLSKDEMCYCLDSYLGLGCDYMANNFYANNEVIVDFTITCTSALFDHHKTQTYYHVLGVQYGVPGKPTPEY